MGSFWRRWRWSRCTGYWGEVTKLPAAGEAVLQDLGYVMHDGGHGTVPGDFDVYTRFMRMHLGK